MFWNDSSSFENWRSVVFIDKTNKLILINFFHFSFQLVSVTISFAVSCRHLYPKKTWVLSCGHPNPKKYQAKKDPKVRIFFGTVWDTCCLFRISYGIFGSKFWWFLGLVWVGISWNLGVQTQTQNPSFFGYKCLHSAFDLNLLYLII